MKITALEEYGLRCMLLLSSIGPEETLTLPDFQNKEGLSIPYAGKLLMILKRAGLVKAARGRNGGYALAKAPEKIVLREIFNALGESAFSQAHCERHSGIYKICVHQDGCRVREVWRTFDSFIGRVLDMITLADVANGKFDMLEAAYVPAAKKEIGNGAIS
jgi:Rrf2 family transcriptional regulator, iron-sulfur cluster assembly transcription factor